ncbi:metalloregulator ArsR/SmtB family transcription factor [Methanosarcina sp.]|uniref:ArsR/SmtB family transcription factor n=1 Tax=Methanosarcina sp. TaxID=2213 RepID=UPI002ABB156D|nr:metalloregulator ArsR/SmtB family transcription factor [Methanosarcina sp.]MDY9927843.1 metalloregulator ArsR/SmtB family transcription factor [Methanosarcina sp.]
MSYCCPADSEKKKWEEKMLQEIDFLDNDIKKASEIFSALGHPIRLKIAYFLSQRDHCVCELVFKLNERQNLVSHHLTIMKNSGIVEAYSSSKWRFYRLNPEFAGVLNIISQI